MTNEELILQMLTDMKLSITNWTISCPSVLLIQAKSCHSV
jgi:hypothetical protein